MIVIVDYQMGNVGSIKNMLKKLGYNSVVSGDTEVIASAERLILPGVGAFDEGMKNLERLNLISILNKQVLKKQTPILGICLGMQLMCRKSEEGERCGLGWIEADTVRFKRHPDRHDIKIPQMGWNRVTPVRYSSLFTNFHDDIRFYFVHSYHLICDNPDDVLGKTVHGYEFASAIEKNNISGTQFHPEKSHKYGMKLLKNFIEINFDA